MARGRGSGKKSGSKPTSSRRAHKQEVMERYAKAREDAQLLGLIPTTPEEALLKKPERVDPTSQDYTALPEVVKQSLREGWATPDSAKPSIIAALLEPFFNEEVVLDENGQQVRVKPSRKLLMELAKTLHMLDQTQYQRDHPSELSKPGQTNNNTTVNVYNDNLAAASLIRKMIEDGDFGELEALPAPDQSGTPGISGQQREVETRTTFEGDK